MPPTEQQATVPKNNKRFVALFLIVILLAGAGVGSYWLYKNDKLGPLSPAKKAGQNKEEEFVVGQPTGDAPQSGQIPNFEPSGSAQILPDSGPTPPEPTRPAVGG